MWAAAPPLEYSLLMLLALLVAGAMFQWTGVKLPLRGQQRAAILFGALAGSFLAARVPFLWGDLSQLCTWQGWLGNGKTILFGLVGGYAGVELAKWWVGVKVSTGDSFAVPVALGIAVGRMACFMGGCCYGTPTSLPWGVRFADGIPRHPTQLYEVAFHLATAVGLAWCADRGLFRNRLIRVYFVSYAVFRFFTEFIRPEDRLPIGLTWYQCMCMLVAGLFVLIDWWTLRKVRSQVSFPAP